MGYVNNHIPLLIDAKKKTLKKQQHFPGEEVTLIVFLLTFHLRQWLPQEKIEHLGVTQEGDNIKLGMAGHSKRSVREAYSRAKKWLRQKSLSMSSPCDGKKGCKSMDTTSEAEMTDPNTNDVNTTDSRNDKARYET